MELTCQNIIHDPLWFPSHTRFNKQFGCHNCFLLPKNNPAVDSGRKD